MSSSPASVILVANKIDQIEDRMVTTEEGQLKRKKIAVSLTEKTSSRVFRRKTEQRFGL